MVHERVRVPGTSIYLTYSSSQAPGYKSTLILLLTSQTLPRDLVAVHVRVVVEGVESLQVLAPRPSLTYTFTWDRLNAYKQKVYGLATATSTFKFNLDPLLFRISLNKPIYLFPQIIFTVSPYGICWTDFTRPHRMHEMQTTEIADLTSRSSVSLSITCLGCANTVELIEVLRPKKYCTLRESRFPPRIRCGLRQITLDTSFRFFMSSLGFYLLSIRCHIFTNPTLTIDFSCHLSATKQRGLVSFISDCNSLVLAHSSLL